MIFLRDLQCVIHRIDHHDTTKQGLCHIPVFFFRLCDLICHAQSTALIEHFGRLKFLRIPDRIQRQEGRTSEAVLLQIFDHLLCRFFIFRNDVLDITAKRRLDCGLKTFFRFDDIRNDTDHTLHIALPLHDAAHGVSVSFVTLGQVRDRFQLGLVLMVCDLLFLQFPVQFSQFIVDLPGAFFLLLLFKIQLFQPFVDIFKILLQSGNDRLLFFLIGLGLQKA